MKTFKFTLVALALLGTATLSKADVCMPGDADFDELTCTDNGGTVGTPLNLGGGPSSPQGVPVDGGASLLIVAGAGYGLRNLRKKFGPVVAKA